MNCISQMKGYLTRGTFYPILRENDDNFIVVCDNGQELGFSKSRFEKPIDFYLDVETYFKEKTEES
jgi:hypothetical protein